MKIKRVAIIDKTPGRQESIELRNMYSLEKQAMKTVASNCTRRARELAKLDDEGRAKLMLKLAKIGYEFDASDPYVLRIFVKKEAAVIPKSRKLSYGAKAAKKSRLKNVSSK